MPSKLSSLFVIYLTLFISMALSIIPWSNSVASFMPNWPILTLMYWCLALPHRVSVGTGFAVGLLLDTLSGNVIGQHALIFSITAFAGHSFYLRIRNYLLWQQSFFSLFFLCLIHTLFLWTSQLEQHSYITLHSYAQPFVSALSWPAIFAVLRLIRRHYNVQ
ncbi:MAG: rod shape-determining protein MreD [Cycloclasticus sp.]|nr:rod shape-determining protein MreD [Cycloclasticus sp.]